MAELPPNEHNPHEKKMKLTPELISKNKKFSKKEQQLIIGTLLNKISLTTKRSSCVYIKLTKFGTIKTHGNKKRLNKLKYLRKYNKSNWVKIKEEQLNDVNFLLF